jgi:ribosomal protein S18 acetylase RimI-like enzyme
MESLDALDLIRLNTQIENAFRPDGDLVPLPGKTPVLFAIHQHRAGHVTYYGQPLPLEVRRQLRTLDPESLLHDHPSVRQILAAHTVCRHVFAAKAYYFARVPAAEEHPDAMYRQAAYVVLVGGEPVSRAWTQEGNDHAAELAVEILPAFRRRGYGRQVVAAWAAHVMAQGKVAFYSHEMGNTASEALARSLGVVQYAISVVYSDLPNAGILPAGHSTNSSVYEGAKGP